MRCLLFLLSALLVHAAGCAVDARPHIVFVMVDDLGYNDVGFNGSPEIQTPNLDRLAREGVVLTSMYVQPRCTPTRAALMTGRYPIRYGLQVGIISPQSEIGVDLRERMLPAELSSLGYRTALVGKWHLGWSKPEYLPLARGFDSQYGMLRAGYIDYTDHTHPRVGRDWFRQQKTLDQQGYTTDLISREAVDVIRKHDLSTSLFLFVAYNAPHSPIQAPPARSGIPDYAGLPEKRRAYAQSVSSLDLGVGEIVDALEARGMLDRSLIVFTSDNGGLSNRGIADNSPLRGGKRDLYEGGIRVCAFARWPGRIAPGRIDEPVHIVDWFATFVQLGGGELGALPSIDGLDITPLLTRRTPTPHKAILLDAGPRRSALRVGDWKLHVLQSKAGAYKTELYRLSSDIGESTDLSSDFPEIVDSMRETLDVFEREARTPLVEH